MVTIKGKYRVGEVVRCDDKLVMSRATRDDGIEVLMVAPISERPDMETIARFRHEFELVGSIDPGWAVVPLELDLITGQIALILSDPGGTPLSRVLDARSEIVSPAEILLWLRLSIAMAEALSGCHACGLIHKDIKPGNILVDSVTGMVRLTGFGFASRMPREQRHAEPLLSIDGTFAYMAPEQTGRMNRSVDRRSDLYSLGVTCYELFTGSLPFTAADPMEWVHCHIAVQPMVPSKRMRGIPDQVSAIIMKLLAKTAEERYQTASGLAVDFTRCMEEFERSATITTFSLGEWDQSNELIIPEKLYGRTRESQALLDAFDRVVSSGSSELILVSGYSGVGKSALVNQIHRPLVERSGMFGSGKFDQHKRDFPYDTFAQAFHVLVRQILSGEKAEIARWADDILAAVESNGRLIVDLIPQIELIIGIQPAVPDLPSNEAQFRFLKVFTKFLGVFARPEAPLVLFLDDIQWMDSGSMKLLEHIMTNPDVSYILMICAYRDNEVHSSHPVMLTLYVIRAAEARIVDILLRPLSLADLCSLVADALHCFADQADDLARLVFEKTAGNPFFSIQLLLTLVEENLLVYDVEARSWIWDVASINNMSYSDNVVELMTGKLLRLAESSRAALQRLACLGISSRVATLGMIFDRSTEEVVAEMEEALRSGFLFINGDMISFAHDRIRDAAYEALPSGERAAVHLHIGRRLLTAMSDEAIVDEVFDVVYQLNCCAELIDDPGERARLCRLNVVAGKKAKASTAYDSARAYFMYAKSLLAADAWEQSLDETFDLFVNLSECEHLASNHDEADKLFRLLLDNARSEDQRAQVWCLRLRVAMVSGRYGDAVTIAIEALALLGLICPESDAELQGEIDSCRAELKFLVGDRTITDLAATPTCVEPKVLTLLGILADAIPCAYHIRPMLYPFMVLKDLILSLRHGVTADSSTAFSSYAVVLVGRYEEIEAAFEFSSLALALNDRFANKQIAGTLLFRHGYFVTPWRKPISSALATLDESYRACMETGNMVYAAYTVSYSGWLMFEKGSPLDEVLSAMRKFISFAHNSRIGWALHAIRYQELFVAGLQGITEQALVSETGSASSADSLAALTATNFGYGIAFYHVMQQITPLLLGRFEEALAASVAAAPMSVKVSPSVMEATHHFYYALTITALFDQSAPEQQEEFSESLVLHRRKLKLWAANCPETFACRCSLVEAEVARIERRDIDAMHLYEQAITEARGVDQLHIEALANERAGLFCIDRALTSIADTYLRNARYFYLRWGAQAKVAQLDLLYPHLAEDGATNSDHTVAFSGHIEGLDLMTVVKAQQAVSGEIVLDRLVEALLRIVVEHAGANRGLLVLSHGDGYRIGASAVTSGNHIEVASSTQPLSADDLPMAIFQYVTHTRERVIVDDAAADNDFSAADYAGRTGTKSILCLPVISRGNLAAVVYLENKLVSSAFTRNHIKALDLLASQAAISLENATLYAELEDRVEERTRNLNLALQEVASRTEQLSIANIELSKKSRQIHDSLVYAVTMQHSLLPDENVMRQSFVDHFVIWQPRDVVSGDIYFCYPNATGCLLAVIDCTGHGVPGALMTMIAGAGFESLKNKQYVDDPAGMLAALNQFVTATLRQELKDSQSDNGMDMGLCCINKKDEIITYAGAKSSLLIVDETELKEIKGDKRSVGYKLANMSFEYTNHTIKLSRNSVYYLHTDGIVDQGGGRKGFGFGVKRLRKLLIENYQKPFSAQKGIIVQALSDYQGDNIRRDDVTVVGFSV